MPPVPTPMQDLIRLPGRTAIVTGGVLGIGYAIAYRLAEADASVVVADVDGEAAETAARRLKEAGFEAAAAETDVADERDVERMVRASVERYGGIDILVNNAGVYPDVANSVPCLWVAARNAVSSTPRECTHAAGPGPRPGARRGRGRGLHRLLNLARPRAPTPTTPATRASQASPTSG